MRLLVDACVAGSVVDSLRKSGFDVEWVAEWPTDPGDSMILQHAFDHKQVLITRDKDFGELIFRDKRTHSGLLRLSGQMTYIEEAHRVLQALSNSAADLERGVVVTVGPHRIRGSKVGLEQ